MQQTNNVSPVLGRKPPAAGALPHPVTHSSSVHPQNLRGQPQPPHQVRPIHTKPQQTLPQQAKPIEVQSAPVQPPQKQPDQNPPKLLDQVRNVLRTKHYSMRTEESYIDWIRRYILFHNKRHPAEMGEKEISEFLTHLAVEEHVAASTQNQALSAILFLYRHVLKREIGRLGELTWAKKPETLPVVLSKEEIKVILSHLSGKDWIMTALMYGCGLRVDECVTLRVKDFDFERNQIVVRRGKCFLFFHLV
ncbi:phage integrase N-terminal SAM-like domain-containing protein [candidate division KSB1 bacterium]|nr:phage integrase N-terminal SAM-like domain-containing protein [candidate division KSB1 bacterium]